MSSPQARSRHRDRRTVMVEKFCAKFDMSLNPLNNGYQLRIENVLDVYPTNGRYCILQTGERGGWDTPADLKRLMLKALPDVKVVVSVGGKKDDVATAVANHVLNKPDIKITIWQKVRRAIRRQIWG